MHHLFFIIITFLIVTPIKAQLFGNRNIIDDNIGGARCLKVIDLDNDNYLDIIVGESQKVSWYKNLGGTGNFAPPVILNDQFWQAFNLDAADIELDGDVDIVVSYFGIDKVDIFYNTGGGNFSTPVTLYQDLNNTRGIKLAKIDTDSKPDMVLGVSNGSGVYWAENLKDGTFGPLVNLAPTLQQARLQQVADMDGDGDNDIVSNGLNPYLGWFENTNSIGAFSPIKVIESNNLYQNSFTLGDIDGDNDTDIISANMLENIILYTNLGNGQFSTASLINNTLFNPQAFNLEDIDNDTDLDILGSTSNNEVFYLLNEGNGVFGVPQFIDQNLPAPRAVVTGDMDNDGDLDIVTGAFEPVTGGEMTLVWYENRTILGIQDLLNGRVQLSPNPVKNTLTITTTLPITQATLFSVSGQHIKTWGNQTQLNLANLQTGIYFITITTPEGKVTKKVIKQ